MGTASVEINIERVKARVEKGGHDVPEVDQRRRYPRTLANMRKLLPEADLAVILDNSSVKRVMCSWLSGIRDTFSGMSPCQSGPLTFEGHVMQLF